MTVHTQHWVPRCLFSPFSCRSLLPHPSLHLSVVCRTFSDPCPLSLILPFPSEDGSTVFGTQACSGDDVPHREVSPALDNHLPGFTVFELCSPLEERQDRLWPHMVLDSSLVSVVAEITTLPGFWLSIYNVVERSGSSQGRAAMGSFESIGRSNIACEEGRFWYKMVEIRWVIRMLGAYPASKVQNKIMSKNEIERLYPE